MTTKVAVVLVTSFIGISPRSANHAYELAESGLYDQVYFIGQKGRNRPHIDTKTYQKVEEHPKIKIIGMPFGWMAVIQKLPNILYFILRILIHFFVLCWIMFFWIKKPQLVIVQNPPSIPVLGFLWLFKAIRRKCLIIVDVHNYGYTLMFKTKSQKMLKFCRWFEQYFTRKSADHCLTVSEKMKTDIMTNWGVKKVKNSVYFRPLFATIWPTKKFFLSSISSRNILSFQVVKNLLGRTITSPCLLKQKRDLMEQYRTSFSRTGQYFS